MRTVLLLACLPLTLASPALQPRCAGDRAVPLRSAWSDALACAEERDGPGAMRALTRAVEAGFDDWQALHTDRALDPVRQERGLRELLAAHSDADFLRLTRPEEPGDPLDLELQVCDPGGRPLPDATVYLYHTDARGSYGPGTSRVPEIFGYLRTDAEGCVRIRTIQPASYPNSAVPQHVHFTVRAPGCVPLTSEVLFEGDPLLGSDGRRHGVVVALERGEHELVARALACVQLRAAR